MKVLQVISSMNTGGMQTSIMNNFKVLSKFGIIFDFIVFEEKEQFFEKEIKELGGTIFKITSRRKNLLKNRMELEKFFKENKGVYKSVEFHQGITYYLPLKLASKYKWKNKIIRNHGIDRNFLKRLHIINEIYIKRKICKLGDVYTSCNMELNNHLFTKQIIENNKVKFIPNSIDTQIYKFNETIRESIRKHYGITDKDLILGHVGLFNEVKNHKFLLEVFKKLSENKNSNYKLMLVGDGELRYNIEDYIKENNLQSKVILVGNVNNVQHYLHSMDIFLFPSIFEGLPMSLIEAQASGLPLVVSNNITRKIKLSDKCYFLSIDDSEEWVRFISRNIKVNNSKERLRTNNDISKSIFDSYNSVVAMKSLYKGE